MIDPTKIALKVLAISDPSIQAHIDDREGVGRALTEFLVENLEEHLASHRFIFRRRVLLREGGIELNYTGDEYPRPYFDYTIQILFYGLMDMHHWTGRFGRGWRCNLSCIPLSWSSRNVLSGNHRFSGRGGCHRLGGHDCGLLTPFHVTFRVFPHLRYWTSRDERWCGAGSKRS